MAGRIRALTLSYAPMRNVPFAPSEKAARSAFADWKRSMIGPAWRRSSSPDSLRVTCRRPPRRSKRGSPTTFSSVAICWLIATLEKVVGLPLFERRGGRRQVTLSESGELLLRHAGPIIDRFQSAKADLAAFSEGAKGTLRIGAYESVSARVLPAILGVFASRWPQVEIDLMDSADDADVLAMVEAGEFDLAFVMDSE